MINSQIDYFKEIIDGITLSEIIIVATDDEYEKAQKIFPLSKIIKTGVGPLNVIENLKEIDRSSILINFGYAGSNCLDIGDKIFISECELYHPNAEFQSPKYKLSDYGIKCFTSNDFVLKSDIEEPCVFDMELAYVLAMGFKNVKSIKIVSDNLSVSEYNKNIGVNEFSQILTEEDW